MTGRSFWEQSVTVLPGIGRVKAGQLAKLGIGNVRELLYHFPRSYQNRGSIYTLTEAAALGEPCATVLTVGTQSSAVRLSGGKTLIKFTAFDSSAKCTILFFNATFVRQIFTTGLSFRFWGTVRKAKNGRGYELVSPAFEQYFEQIRLPDYYPIYPLTSGLKQKSIAAIIGVALMQMTADRVGDAEDPIPPAVRKQYALLSLTDALRAIHQPADDRELEAARNRFVFEELFLFSLAASRSDGKAGAFIRFENKNLDPFLAVLPYSLTNSQKKCIAEITDDLCGKAEKPMNRLVAGDVGCGKTVCAAAAAYLAAINGYQTALMVPTEILASQHEKELKPLLGKLGITVALLSGSMTAAQKRAVRTDVAEGKIQLLIGTHAILTADTVFSSLGLVITDEQHRFGVMQRAGLAGKGKAIHTLLMTATPIPRTLSLILHRNLDVSRITELPPGRQKVDTFVVDGSYRARIYNFIRKHAEEGHQTYIVCPTVEEQDEEDENEDDSLSENAIVGIDYHPERNSTPKIALQSAVEYAARLQNEVFPEWTVALLHGKMKGAEKDKVMADFAAGKTQILVSTTVIEVGVNVPNATLMIVENAERFGLSQLHQLRGRVGRGKAKSYCILLSDMPKDSSAIERLAVLRDHSDGYAIAEADLQKRGPGDFLPKAGGEARQHGTVSFRMGGYCANMEILEQAAAAAAKLLADDLFLEKPENRPAALAVEREYLSRTGILN